MSVADASRFERFEPSDHAGHWNRGGHFVRIHRSVDEGDRVSRRVYLSADVREFLGDPRYIVYYTDEESRRLAIGKATKAEAGAYSLTGGLAAIELPLRKLNVKHADGKRIPITKDGQNGWAIVDFLGGADGTA